MRLRSSLVLCSSILLVLAACNDDDDLSPADGGTEAGQDAATAADRTVPGLDSDGTSDARGPADASVTPGDAVTAEASVAPSDARDAAADSSLDAADTSTEAGSDARRDAEDAAFEAQARDASPDAAPLLTLGGAVPLVIGHRGLPGLFPEETQPAYEAAADQGADSLEEDLHLTKDCILVARHNPWLSDNTNIATVALTNTTVAARKRTVPGVLVDVAYPVATYGGPAQLLTDRTNPADPLSVLKSLVVDGENHTGDWSITDFTLAELTQWIGGTTYDARDQRPSALNGQYPILTMQQIINIAKAKSTALGRIISVYPEAKNPYWNNAQAIANGCGTGAHPFEDAIVKLIVDNGMNSKDAPIYVQSFDPASLKYMRSVGLATKVVQLVDGNDVNYATGEMIYQTDDEYNFVDGRPYSWTLSGDARYFGAMLTPAGLAEIKTYADGIGPWKPQVLALKVVPPSSPSADGSAPALSLANVNSVTPTSLLADAHAAGLFVHTYTFRNETKYLAGLYNGSPAAEYLPYFAAGVDGVFTDFTNTGVSARATFLAQSGR